MEYDKTKFTLIQRIRKQMDESSWTEFTGIYSPFIKAILFHAGAPVSAIDDLSQDIFIKVWKSIENFEYNPDKCRFRTWLSTVCRNTVCNYFKSKRENTDFNEEHMASKSAEIDEIIEREWKIYIGAKALENVSKLFNEKFMYAYKEFQTGRSVPEIAETLEIADSSVYVYSNRVKEAMSQEIIRLVNDLE